MKKVVFVDPLSQIEEGKIGYSLRCLDDMYLAEAFIEFFENAYFGWLARDCPQMLWWQFDDAKVPAGLTFLGDQDQDPFSEHDFLVTKWQFLASKDSKCNQYSTWEVICEDLSGIGNKRVRKKCYSGEEMQEKYKCFGFRVLEAKSEHYELDAFFVTNIIMYEKTAGSRILL